MIRFTVYDSKAQYWWTPRYEKARGIVIRGFADAANDPNTEIGKHPEDYTLFEIGTWDEQTCTDTTHTAPISLGKALDFLINHENKDNQNG